MIDYDNQYFFSEKEICERYNLNYYFFKLYKNDLKMTIVETADYMRDKQKRATTRKPAKPKKAKIIYNGLEFKSLKDFCNIYNLNYGKVLRIKSNHSFSYADVVDFIMNKMELKKFNKLK